MKRICLIVRVFFAALVFCIAAYVMGCSRPEKAKNSLPPLPYPDGEMAKFIQAQVDSSEYLWFLDIKAAASSFMNEYEFMEDGVSTSSIRIVGEGIFHGTVEVELPDKIMVLKMERPFKQKGKNSIWQVIRVEEKPWPDTKSK